MPCFSCYWSRGQRQFSPSSPVMKRGRDCGAAAEQWSSHDKYGRDLTDSTVLGMDQISTSSMHKVPCFLHLWPQDAFPAQSHSRQAGSSLGAPWPQEAIGNREPQGQRSYWVGVNGLFLPSLLCLSYDSFRALHLLMNAKGLGRMQFFKGFLFKKRRIKGFKMRQCKFKSPLYYLQTSL